MDDANTGAQGVSCVAVPVECEVHRVMHPLLGPSRGPHRASPYFRIPPVPRHAADADPARGSAPFDRFASLVSCILAPCFRWGGFVSRDSLGSLAHRAEPLERGDKAGLDAGPGDRGRRDSANCSRGGCDSLHRMRGMRHGVSRISPDSASVVADSAESPEFCAALALPVALVVRPRSSSATNLKNHYD